MEKAKHAPVYLETYECGIVDREAIDIAKKWGLHRGFEKV